MHQWQVWVLIVVSLGALLLALYCLFFMAPLKRFLDHVATLGGGIRGIEEHVRAVREEVEGKLSELEGNLTQQTAQVRDRAEGGQNRLGGEVREMQKKLEELRKDVQSLQAELRQTRSDALKLSQNVEALTKQMDGARSDFDALDTELRESVRRLVADSFSTVESTVLSALEAVQEEMLSGSGEVGAAAPRALPPRPTRHGSSPGGTGASRDNIISAGPLFAGLRGEKQQDNEGGHDQATEDTEGPDKGGT